MVTGIFFDGVRTMKKYILKVCNELPNQKATFTLCSGGKNGRLTIQPFVFVMLNMQHCTCVDTSENNVYFSEITFVTLLQLSFDKVFFVLQ